MTKINRNNKNEHWEFPTKHSKYAYHIKWMFPGCLKSCFCYIRHCFVLRYCIQVLFLFTILLIACRSALHKRFDDKWVLSPINYMERDCPYGEDYISIGQLQQQVKDGIVPIESIDPTLIANPVICMITLADGGKRDVLHRLVRWRNFDNIMEMTIPNKQSYCDKHGYQLYDESTRSLDTTRPPSWSKIQAALRMMTKNNNNYHNVTETTTITTETQQPQQKCEWIFWLDADTVIMNSKKRVEDFLPLRNSTINFIVTVQKGNSWNAGAWLIRNNQWSYEFLQTWWNMKEFVKPKGLSVSGDNDALKHFLTTMLYHHHSNETKTTSSQPPFHDSIVTPPRCQFNSDVAHLVSLKEKQLYEQYIEQNQLEQIPSYLNPTKYHKKDLIAHAAGFDNKIATIKLLLQDAE